MGRIALNTYIVQQPAVALAIYRDKSGDMSIVHDVALSIVSSIRKDFCQFEGGLTSRIAAHITFGSSTASQRSGNLTRYIAFWSDVIVDVRDISGHAATRLDDWFAKTIKGRIDCACKQHVSRHWTYRQFTY